MKNQKNYKKSPNDKCNYCGAKDFITIDHIIPKSKGGTEEKSNKQKLCVFCNHAKSNIIVKTINDVNIIIENSKKLRLKPNIVKNLIGSFTKSHTHTHIHIGFMEKIKQIQKIQKLEAANNNWFKEPDR